MEIIDIAINYLRTLQLISHRLSENATCKKKLKMSIENMLKYVEECIINIECNINDDIPFLQSIDNESKKMEGVVESQESQDSQENIESEHHEVHDQNSSEIIDTTINTFLPYMILYQMITTS